MYDPCYYCCECGKKLGTKSHDIQDSLGESYYENLYCSKCEQEELAYLNQDDQEEEQEDYPEYMCQDCGRCWGSEYEALNCICKEEDENN